MSNALVGHTGFVGRNILATRPFAHCYNSTNAAEMTGRSFEEVWCSALPGTKWAANADPEADLANLRAIEALLGTVRSERFVLVSTIDVHNDHEPYGRHRRMFEQWVAGRFASRCIVRLPALFGRGLKKNVLFDLLTGSRLDQIHAGDAYQWYDLADLVADVELAAEHGLQELELYTQPVENTRLLGLFPEVLPADQARRPRRYDATSAQAGLFGRVDYVRTADEMLSRIAAFVTAVRTGDVPLG